MTSLANNNIDSGFEIILNQSSGKTIVYEKNRILPKVTGSKYPGKIIAWKYEVVRDTNFKIISSTRMDSYEYWKPIESEDWIRYNAGDELETQEATSTPVYDVKKWLGQKSNLVDRYRFPYGSVLTYGNKQYRSTNRTISWKFISDKQYMGTAYKQMENPYSYDNIQVWTLLPSDPAYSFAYSTGKVTVAFYWYHPRVNAFYPLPDSYGFIGLMNESYAKSFVDFSLSLLGISRQDKKAPSFSELTSIIKNVIPPDQLNFRASVQAALVSYYAETFGVSPEAALDAVNEAYGKKKPTGKVSVGGSKGGKSNNNGTPTAGRSVSVRGSFREGYAPYDGSDAATPQMVQQYKLPGFSDPVTKRYSFVLRPNQISYSNIGSEWTDIPRSGAAPLIDWKSYKLMQIAFQFIVVPDREGNLDILKNEKEITLSVDNQLRVLQEMASAPYPVVLLGFDDMLTNEVRFPFNSGRGVEFVITDFAVSSLFRTGTGAINRAQCDITLREVPIESIAYIDFPALKFPKTKTPPKPKKDKDKEGGVKLDDTSTRLPKDSFGDYEITPDEKLDFTPG